MLLVLGPCMVNVWLRVKGHTQTVCYCDRRQDPHQREAACLTVTPLPPRPHASVVLCQNKTDSSALTQP